MISPLSGANFMNVIFLDVDGVLNNRSSFSGPGGMWRLDEKLIKRMRRIIKKTGVKIVLSSSWRMHKEGVDRVKEWIDIYDVTPQLSDIRGIEINAWIIENKVDKYCIIDDDSDMLPGQKLFKTTFEMGLTARIANEVIQYFNTP